MTWSPMSDPAGDASRPQSTNLTPGGTPPPTSQVPPNPTPSGAVLHGYLLVHTPEFRPWSRGSWISQPPEIAIDGQVVGGNFGLNQIAVTAGVHHVEIYSRTLWKYGHAAIDVTVPPGALVPVYYGSPGTYFSQRGRIGFVPQGMSPGVKIFLFIFIAPMVAFTLLFFLIFVSSLIRGIF